MRGKHNALQTRMAKKKCLARAGKPKQCKRTGILQKHRNNVRIMDGKLLPNEIAKQHIVPIYEEIHKQEGNKIRADLRDLLAELILTTENRCDTIETAAVCKAQKNHCAWLPPAWFGLRKGRCQGKFLAKYKLDPTRPPTWRDLERINKRIEYLDNLGELKRTTDEEQECLFFEGLLKATRQAADDIRCVSQRLDVQAKRLIEINRILQKLEAEPSNIRKMKLMQDLVAEGRAITQEMANIQRTWSEVMKQMAPQILWWLLAVVGVVVVLFSASYFTKALVELAAQNTEFMTVLKQMNDRWTDLAGRIVGMAEGVGSALGGIGRGIKDMAMAFLEGQVRVGGGGKPAIPAIQNYQTGLRLLRAAGKQDYHWPLPLYQDGNGKSVILAADVRRLFPHKKGLICRDLSGRHRVSHYSLYRQLCRFRQAKHPAPRWARNPKITAWVD